MKVAAKTLNIDLVRENPQLFQLGVVRKIYTIGPLRSSLFQGADISIVEFEDGDSVRFLAYRGFLYAQTERGDVVVDPSLEGALLRVLVMNRSELREVEPIVLTLKRLLGIP